MKPVIINNQMFRKKSFCRDIHDIILNSNYATLLLRKMSYTDLSARRKRCEYVEPARQ